MTTTTTTTTTPVTGPTHQTQPTRLSRAADSPARTSTRSSSRPHPTDQPVVASWGLGADSTAVILRWLLEPGSRDFPLHNLTIVVSMTGDEWPITGVLATTHVLPLLARHGVRLIQAGRSGRVKASGEGLVILDDSTAPQVLHLDGDWRLSDELFAAGTIPQSAGPRLCSVAAKAEVLEPVIAAVTAGQPYRHVLGYETGELARIRRDRTYNTATRTGWYPMLDWGWDRAAALAFLARHTGVWPWPKSACTMCPFALQSKASLAATLHRFATEDPAAGARALMLEHLALCLNPRQGLIAGARLVDQVRAVGGCGGVLDRFAADLDAAPHALYQVGRVWVPRRDDPDRVATSGRSLRKLATGTRVQMLAALHQAAAAEGLRALTLGDRIPRVYRRRRLSDEHPGVEEFLVAGPAAAEPKQHRSFSNWRAQTLQTHAHNHIARGVIGAATGR